MKYEFDVSNDSLDIRDMTPEEIAQDENNQSALAEKLLAKKLEIESKAVARQAILDRLGLTADEAKLLLG
jgi:hypothetical protein